MRGGFYSKVGNQPSPFVASVYAQKLRRDMMAVTRGGEKGGKAHHGDTETRSGYWEQKGAAQIFSASGRKSQVALLREKIEESRLRLGYRMGEMGERGRDRDITTHLAALAVSCRNRNRARNHNLFSLSLSGESGYLGTITITIRIRIKIGMGEV